MPISTKCSDPIQKHHPRSLCPQFWDAPGYFHIYIAELRHEGGKVFLYVAVDRTSKLVFARIHRKATKLVAAGFLMSLIRTVPYRIHTVLTDTGIQFERGTGLTFPHIFGRVYLETGVEHRLNKPYHPWTNGQAERMVRTIKEATVKSFLYTSIAELRRRVRDWLIAYNFAKQLKALRFKTPMRPSRNSGNQSQMSLSSSRTITCWD